MMSPQRGFAYHIDAEWNIGIVEKKDHNLREKLKIFGPALAFTLAGFVIAYQFVAPAPPRTITMATGSPQGTYFSTGQAYQEILAREGVTLNLINTAGSIENIKLLETASEKVDIAFVQGGTSQLSQGGNLVSLGSLFFEPLWIFHRAALALERPPDLKGLRVAVGPEGSGTKILSLQLLGLNGIDDANTQILSYGSRKAAELLLNGEIDVAFFVANHRTKFILQLFKSRTIALMGLDRAEAYAIRFPYLHVLKLPEGVIDFVANIPPRTLTLVAPTAHLVAHSDLHPALIELLVYAAEEVHYKGGGFEKQGQFPAPKYLDFKLSKEAARYYKSGPSLLMRYFPFWVANFISRMKVLLLPLIVLLFPLVKMMPPAYRWRMRSRIYRWYAELETIDAEINQKETPLNIEKTTTDLAELERKVAGISVPLAFREKLYGMRLHIELLRKKLKK